MANWTSLSSADIIVIFKNIYATKNAAFYLSHTVNILFNITMKTSYQSYDIASILIKRCWTVPRRC